MHFMWFLIMNLFQLHYEGFIPPDIVNSVSAVTPICWSFLHPKIPRATILHSRPRFSSISGSPKRGTEIQGSICQTMVVCFKTYPAIFSDMFLSVRARILICQIDSVYRNLKFNHKLFFVSNQNESRICNNNILTKQTFSSKFVFVGGYIIFTKECPVDAFAVV